MPGIKFLSTTSWTWSRSTATATRPSAGYESKGAQTRIWYILLLKWISNFYAKAGSLLRVTLFSSQWKCFICFWRSQARTTAKASLGAIHRDILFAVETEASDYVLDAILSQNEHLVVCLSRTSTCERRYTPRLKKRPHQPIAKAVSRCKLFFE